MTRGRRKRRKVLLEDKVHNGLRMRRRRRWRRRRRGVHKEQLQLIMQCLVF
jgi:hypothetical protein